jgi:hypothetical protein
MSSVFYQQPAHVRPEEAHERAMGIALVIRKVVVPAVHGGPMRRRVLHRADGDHHESMLEPTRAREAAMGDEPVESRD